MTDDAHVAPTPPVTEPAFSTGAERMRRHRARRRQGVRCVTTELHDLEIDALIRKGWLKAETCNDLAALVEALHGHLGYSLLGERDV
jgi:hypothetical protein